MRKIMRLSMIFTLIVLIPISAGADFEKTKIAVLDFGIQGKGFETEDMGKIVAEWLTTAFVKAGRFDVIERRMLKKILGEQQLGLSGALDSESVTKIGQLLGVQVIISGSVMKFQNVLQVNARIVDVESASILAAENVKSSTATRLQDLVIQMADKIISSFPLEGYIVNREQNAVSIDLGKRLGVKPGMRFIVFKEGKTIKHPTTGEVLDVEKIHVGLIEIKSTSAKMAKAVIVRENSPKAIAYGQQVKNLVGPEEGVPPAAATAAPAKKEKSFLYYLIPGGEEEEEEDVPAATASPAPAEKAAPAKEKKSVFSFLSKAVEKVTPQELSKVKTTGSSEPIHAKAGQKIKLAILPWRLTGDAAPRNFVAISVFQQIFDVHKSFVPVYSFYDLGHNFSAKAISNDLLSKKIKKDLWKKDSFFGAPKPNIDLAYKIGKQLGVDAVFICDINVGNEDPPQAKFVFYLINVDPKGMLYHSSQTPDFEGGGYNTFKNLVEKVLKHYMG